MYRLLHQHAGLNRMGKYLEPAQEKGPRDKCGDAQTGRHGKKPNQIWRRITGIFEGVELSEKERRRGLKLLVRRIEERVKRRMNSCAESEISTPELSLAQEWEFAPECWAALQSHDVSVQRICAELGVSEAMLSRLIKEFCGLGASELIDCVRVSRLKKLLGEKLRAAAFELWGAPGSLVWEKLGSVGETNRVVAGTPSSRGGADESRGGFFGPGSFGGSAGAGAMSKVAGRGRPTHRFVRQSRASRYFRMSPQQFFEETRAEERERRLAELLEFLDTRRGRTGSQLQTATARGTQARFRNSDCGFRIGDAEIDVNGLFDLDVFALNAGFSSSARLKRACLNVFGKTLRQLEGVLAEEVLQFYLCAEDKALREIAARENEIAIVFRARELYHGSEDPPKPPFLDEWSKFEELKPYWLSRMREMFG